MLYITEIYNRSICCLFPNCFDSDIRWGSSIKPNFFLIVEVRLPHKELVKNVVMNSVANVFVCNINLEISKGIEKLQNDANL